MMKVGGVVEQNLDFTKLIFAWSIDDNNYKVEKEKESLDDLVNMTSVLYKDAKWKVLFSDAFRRSFGMLTCDRFKKLVLNILLRLSTGWRPKRSLGLCQENSSKGLKQFNVEGLYIVCTLDIIKDIQYEQVLKVWDILPFQEIPKLTKRLENIFYAYTEEYINRCTENRFEGYLEVPSCWPASQVMTRFRHPVSDESHNEVSVNPGGGRNYVENSKVSESLLLMKFYLLSYEVVCHLLSGRQVDLPMQVTDEQMDVILFKKSSFIIGRSGTGKTTILTRKLFQNEHRVVNNSVGTYAAENNQLREAEVVHDPDNNKPTVLRQLFVTVSPQLCYAVKQHVSHLTSNSSNGNSSAEIDLDDVDITSEFSDIPDTFIDIPRNIYPLVITFHKFLMMLDGTLGNSFFEKFLEAREGFDANRIRSRSVALQTFIRLREVTFDRFCSLYWPHFNSNLTKKLDPSRVFTEIISHIKGGSEGRLSFEGYSLLAKSRSSTLTEQKREIIYTLFKAYEKMKTERGEFDLGDFVNDIHERLRNGNYEGDQIDFVYIDEVQDLSMRQISLFKYICQNVDEGFVFAGDTAQTIAKGIDFRFQDIRSLFYKEFLSTRKSRKEEKGVVSEIKQMKQNFRTHAGVLDLAQSVIDILYCYFVHSIDNLEPETSLISGEAPVFLESCNDENAIMTIFGGSKSGGEIVGFGAEQVILVRDDRARTEIIESVGKQALVLTILECKGLEFQDVLLYNFFGTSPLKDQWRVIYGYMKKHNWLDDKLPQSFPIFDEARHSLLCSELKQLYVAITRTRQRLWICENKEELSKPMFDYWKRKGLVQIRKLDDSMAQAMQVASSPREWQERGKKLFYEKNFGMATFCFERAGDAMWLKLAKACGLRASADQIRGTHPESYFGYLREAAGLFESIGKLDSAASCYCDLGEYERAGKIYMHKCGKFDAAAECFTLAGCYSEAAEAYVKRDQFSNCLSVCKSEELFDKELEEHLSFKSKELEEVEQEFLENCALDYHELLLLKEESGHFLEDAELARSSGALLKEADLLEMAGKFKEAALLLLWYVFISSLWGDGNISWPLKQFAQKEELCNKVKLLAKSDSGVMYNFVCSELKILSDAAAECFTLAGCYSEAAEAYVKRDQFSNCLSVCKSEKLFDKELEEHLSFKSKELEEVEQEFLENCALDYHELLLLKEESGHFLDDAELARSSGALLKEADLLEKAGKFKEAALLLLWYVFISSLWGDGNISWPLKQFAQKEELCNKVKLLAKSSSGVMYNFVCSELTILSDQHNSLPELKQDLCESRKYRSLRGEILLIRKILDKHLQMNSSSYDWEDKLPVDIYQFCEDKMFQNRVSVRTLVIYWNMWKNHILDLLRSSLENEEPSKASEHADFCLYYFGVRKQFLKGNTVYFSLNKDADWIRNTCNKGLQREEKRIHFDGRELVSAMRSYWQSELLSVGIKVLETLEALRKSKSNGSAFHQGTSLLHIFEVSKFLLDFQCHNLTNPYKKRLQYFLGISLSYIDIVIPLDWRKSVDEGLVSLRETDLSVNLLEEIILQTVDIKALEKVIIICLCSRVSVAVYKNLINKLKIKDPWKSFVEKFRDRGLRDVFVARALQHALEHSFGTNSSFLSVHSFGYLLDRLLLMQSFSSRKSYTTRSSFVGSFTHIQSASSSSVRQSSLNLSVLIERIEDILSSSEFGILMIQRSKIDASYYPLLVLKMVMILSLICLKLPEYSHWLLRHLSGYGNYAYFLPKKFVSCLLRKSKNEELNLDPEVVAEAFSSIDDPLLIISSEDGSPKINAPCAIFVDLRKSKEEIMNVLFPRKNTHNASTSSSSVNAGAIPEGSSSETLPDTVMDINRVELQMNWKVIEEISEAINEKKGVAPNKLPAATRIMNELDISRATFLLAAAAQSSCTSYKFINFEKFVFHVNEGLKILSFAFDTRVPEDDYSRLLNSSTVKDLRFVENNYAIFITEAQVVADNHTIVWKNLRMGVDALQNVRHYVDQFFRRIDDFLNHHVTSQVTKVEETGDEASVVLENQSKCENTQDGNNEKGKGNNKGKKSKKSKGKKKHY